MSADPFERAATLEGVPAAFASARDGVDVLLRDRGLRRTAPAATAESLLRGARASAALAGSEYALEQVRAGGGNATVQAAVRLSTHVLGLLPVWQRSPVQALARMHAVAAPGQGAESGRPTSAAGVARLRALGDALAVPTQAPGMVVAALVHAEIAAASAFDSYDGLIARAAERLVLVSAGVDPTSVTVPEAGHLSHRQSYGSALEAYCGGAQSAVQPWLLHAAAAYAAGAEAAADLL